MWRGGAAARVGPAGWYLSVHLDEGGVDCGLVIGRVEVAVVVEEGDSLVTEAWRLEDVKERSAGEKR